jgi:hypothetical protein
MLVWLALLLSRVGGAVDRWRFVIMSGRRPLRLKALLVQADYFSRLAG